MVVFVEQQHGPQPLPPLLWVVEKSIYVKVFVPNYVVILIKLNMLWLDSKLKTILDV
jgi:hypothetical protein